MSWAIRTTNDNRRLAQILTAGIRPIAAHRAAGHGIQEQGSVGPLFLRWQELWGPFLPRIGLGDGQRQGAIAYRLGLDFLIWLAVGTAGARGHGTRHATGRGGLCGLGCLSACHGDNGVLADALIDGRGLLTTLDLRAATRDQKISEHLEPNCMATKLLPMTTAWPASVLSMTMINCDYTTKKSLPGLPFHFSQATCNKSSLRQTKADVAKQVSSEHITSTS